MGAGPAATKSAAFVKDSKVFTENIATLSSPWEPVPPMDVQATLELAKQTVQRLYHSSHNAKPQ